MQNVRSLFQNNCFQEGDILYVQRQNRKTVISLRDGREISTYEPVKNVMTELSPEIFDNINKGIVINRTCIKKEVEGLVFMCDGMGFARRKKPLPRHEAACLRERTDLRLMEELCVHVKVSDSRKREVVASREKEGLRNRVSFELHPGVWLEAEFVADDSRPLESVQARHYKESQK